MQSELGRDAENKTKIGSKREASYWRIIQRIQACCKRKTQKTERRIWEEDNTISLGKVEPN